MGFKGVYISRTCFPDADWIENFKTRLEKSDREFIIVLPGSICIDPRLKAKGYMSVMICCDRRSTPGQEGARRNARSSLI